MTRITLTIELDREERAITADDLGEILLAVVDDRIDDWEDNGMSGRFLCPGALSGTFEARIEKVTL